MLDIKFIRENLSVIQDAAEKKGISFDFDHFLRLDDERVRLVRETDELRATQNAVSADVASMGDIAERQNLISRMKEVKEKLKAMEDSLRDVLVDWEAMMLRVPNIPNPTSPIGKDDADNLVIRHWGEKTNFDFEPKDHIEIMQNLGMVDFERGTKVHGFRGYYLTGEGVRLCFAIWQYALDFWSNKGFNPVIPPINVKRDSLLGCGFIPQGEEDIYKAQDETYFVGTSEVPLMGMYMNEILDQKQLPIKMLGFSPCYRLEAGSYSKDTKGLIRVHEFYKFEQVILCEASHEESVKWHEQINANTEEFIQSIGIPYQVLDLCTGDMGFTKVRAYDIELWVPKEEKYREISSASYFHDFQTRRLNIRYRDEEGKMRFTHSLNCTAIPTPRLLVSLVENFQQADGSIKIPEVLQKYMGGKTEIR